MALQTFTAGQILTAAQMTTLQTNDYNQTVSTKTASYVLVAADKGTRVVMNAASATTITVNTSLFAAGDTLYLQNINTGVCTVTAGTATVTSAGSLAIPQWGSGTLYFTSASAAIYFPSAATTTNPALVLISSTTIGSAVTSVTVSNAFSATYDNYFITVSGGIASTTVNLSFALGASTTGYYAFDIFGAYTSNTINGFANANAAFINIGVGTTNSLDAQVFVKSPFLSKTTGFVYDYSLHATSGNQVGLGRAFLNDTTSYTAFTLGRNTGTITGGTIRVYGYQNS